MITELSPNWSLDEFFSHRLQCLLNPGVRNTVSLPELLCPTGDITSTEDVSFFWRVQMAVVIWLLLMLPFHIAEDVPTAVDLWRWLWALCSVCILAVRLICSFEEHSMEGHTLFIFPLLPLWDQLPFHFCFIGFLKGCQLDIGKWGFSLLQTAENKHQYVAV